MRELLKELTEATMSDNLYRRQPEDPHKINLNQQWEVDYWTKALGVSEPTLRLAVASVGVLVADVKIWLVINRAGA